MRDSKMANFCPVVIKQEPRDFTDQPTTTATATTFSNAVPSQSYSAVDLRSTPTTPVLHAAATLSRGSLDSGSLFHSDSRHFVAEIARRVREESCSLQLSPGSGPLSALKGASGLALCSSSSLAAQGKGKSRGEYACGECSSRFDTARDYRAHCLTHQVLMAESKLRTTRGGGAGGGEGLIQDGEEDSGSAFGGGGSGMMEGASFTCEDCNTRFSSRDTYAMHMLIRAKNEACSPCRPVQSSPATASTTTAITKQRKDSDTNTDSNNCQLPPLSPSVTVPASTPLSMPAPALFLAANSPPDLKHEPLVANISSREGRRLHETSQDLLSSLGMEVGHVTSYRPAWWNKYMPWIAGAGFGNGSSTEVDRALLPMVCYVCGEMFSNRDSLAMHVLFHTRDASTSSQDSASPWRKLLPSLSTLPASNPVLLMKQLQQAVHYSQAVSFNPCRAELNPSEAAAASAETVAMAAVTPALSSTTLPSATRGSSLTQPPKNCFKDGISEVCGQMDWTSSLEDRGQNRLTLPQRGSSAPIPNTTGSNVNNLIKPRPLSADHVAHRPRPLILNASDTADGEHGINNAASETSWNPFNRDSSNWYSDSYSQIHHTSAFNVYRLQQLKKHRLVKGVYRRPGTRGRPPMTIYGTGGGRSLDGLAPQRIPLPEVSSSTSVGTTLTSSSSSSSSTCSSKVSSMVQALTSQGHEVSACGYCELLFGDRTLYQLHMGLHNVNNPWQCNACGHVCTSRLHFATHTLHY